jgi:hypothetical protein
VIVGKSCPSTDNLKFSASSGVASSSVAPGLILSADAAADSIHFEAPGPDGTRIPSDCPACGTTLKDVKEPTSPSL